MRCAAVIGTRQPSADALKAEKKICDYLAEYGWNIVSGLAFGCDETAHRTAVEYWKNTGKGTTTAILADGLDAGSIYPKENAELADEIVDCGGLLLSEYMIGTSCRPYYLTERDKWQAQLSDIVIPVQTGVAGGTFHALTRAAELDIPSFIPYLREYDSPDCEQIDLCRKGMKKAVEKYKCRPFRTVLEFDRMLKPGCSA
jgi:DNA processing protein